MNANYQVTKTKYFIYLLRYDTLTKLSNITLYYQKIKQLGFIIDER